MTTKWQRETADLRSSHDRINGIGDFNADGRSDVLWRRVDGVQEVRLSLVNADGSVKPDIDLSAGSADWRLNAVMDLDGNGRTDLVWRRADDTGEARIRTTTSSP